MSYHHTLILLAAVAMWFGILPQLRRFLLFLRLIARAYIRSLQARHRAVHHRHNYQPTGIRHPWLPFTWLYTCKCKAERWEVQDL